MARFLCSSWCIMVQGAWGIVPVFLNQRAPAGARAVLPGFVYQIGNFAAAVAGPIQTTIAANRGGDYSFALLIVAIVIALCALTGRESRGTELAEPAETA